MAEPIVSGGRRKRGTGKRLKKNQELESVVIRETFQFDQPNGEQGLCEGAYIAAEINSRRYYGVLIDQDSLRAASILHLQDEASGLDLNKRMETLLDQKIQATGAAASPTTMVVERPSKRPKVQESAAAASATGPTMASDLRGVQKFRYVPSSRLLTADNTKHPPKNETMSGYRVLLATYSDVEAAAEGSDQNLAAIQSACERGGDFVADYYYQYQLPDSTLQVAGEQPKMSSSGVRLSLPMNRFLALTSLPEWYPLSTNGIGKQSKALGILNLQHKGGLIQPIPQSTEASSGGSTPVPIAALPPMEDRRRFRVCVVGGGIAGLSTCMELFRVCDHEGIAVEVVLVEGRDRLGGRVHTDSQSLSTLDDKDPVTIELGASWIHGVENNPIMTLAREIGVTFVNVDEEVQMLHSDAVEVDPVVDEQAGELFDKLLESAVDAVWDTAGNAVTTHHRAIRWYAANLCGPDRGPPTVSMIPDNRRSNDASVDEAIAAFALKDGFSSLTSISTETKYMLQWYTKNEEKKLGANIADISMKYWDVDDRYAFEGGDVLLKEGYSRLVQHMFQSLTARGDCFKCLLKSSAARIEYNCASTKRMQIDHSKKTRMLDLSDSCCVTTNMGVLIKSDFVVCAVPLGVLKASVEKRPRTKPPILFTPSLPDVKQDAIAAVGFGLLNKIFLRFDCPFWRTIKTPSGSQPVQFGNASAHFPHHFMFVDVGAAWNYGSEYPSVLMSFVSGKEAAACELLRDEDIVQEVLSTLRELFGAEQVPNPLSWVVTRWGSDEFSRGSHTFLPPGATDDDLRTLHTPINGNGDSALLEGPEIMRLFFAGEHTSALHPSATHGALLSGSRVATEIADTMLLRYNDQLGGDKVVPLAHFCKLNPTCSLCCAFCGREGSTTREGKLLAFARGSRYMLCHNNCSEFSPEVGFSDGKWQNVFSAVSRSKTIHCIVCGKSGASIGCSELGCNHSVHYSCGEDTGWRFGKDGKAFFCSSHRKKEFNSSRRVSIDHFVAHMGSDLRCVLCGQGNESEDPDTMRAYIVPASVAGNNVSSMVALHSYCAKYTNVVALEDDVSFFGQESASANLICSKSSSALACDYVNVGAMMEAIKICGHCGYGGATIACSHAGCAQSYHYTCAKSQKCLLIGDNDSCFCKAHESYACSTIRNTTPIGCPANENMLTQIHAFLSDKQIPLRETTEPAPNRVEVMIKRVSFADDWAFELNAIRSDDSESWFLYIAEGNGLDPQFKPGDLLVSLNGLRIGSGIFAFLEGVVDFMNSRTHVKMTIERS